MRKPRIFCPELSSPTYKCINIKQIHHLAKVLRLKVNDQVELFDGKGTLARGVVQKISKDHIKFEVRGLLFAQNPYLRFYQAIIPYIKKENLIYTLQKLVELGINSIFIYKPELLDQSLAKKDLTKLNDRVEEALIHACEQSGCNHLPKTKFFNNLTQCLQSIKGNTNFDGLFVLDTIANQFFNNNENLSLEEISIITGPESGYSEKERETMNAFGLRSLKIGHYVLRAETAPVIGISKFHTLLGEN